MCGIVGISSIKPVAARSWLKAGRDSMIHRGPDDAGEWWSADRRVGLAHRRLSIIDLTAAGRQPMQDQSGTLSVVFNGEIYNFSDLRNELIEQGHSFKSHSDTEVILAAYREWGLDCVSHFNGMFAFALFDECKKIMFLARDRAGEKPLFYHYKNGVLHFASELKALLADPSLPRRIDPESLDCYLTMGYVPGEHCILQGFNKLPPAHAMIFNLLNAKTKIFRYWQIPVSDNHELDKNVKVDKQALLNELEKLLKDSVRRQLVADVPVGVLLSGGVDSSLVTAMAVGVTSKIKTFTIRFSGHAKHDETEHARLVARHFGTEHVELEGDSATPELLGILACEFDEPIVDSSMIPTYLVSKLVRQQCKVALGGDGGDELFGGYHHYSRMLWMQKYLGLIPWLCRRAIADTAKWLLPVGLKGRNYLQSLGANLRKELPLMTGIFDQTTRRNLLSTQNNWQTHAENIVQSRTPAYANLVQRATRMDFENYLAEDILVKVDRASMINSLEVRAPFLDYHIIEFAFGRVPSFLKTTHTNKKILLKGLAQKMLPQEFDYQRKQGFAVPLSAWLKDNAFKLLFDEVLRDSQCSFDRQTVEGLLQGQQKGRSNSERLFALVLFELWRTEYKVSF